jgi:hypothetical protein
MRWIPVSALCLMSCAGCERPVTEAPGPAAEQVVPIAPSEEPAPSFTVASLYADCRDRVEKPEEPQECTSDEECVRAGGSLEICTTVISSKDLISTAELRPCFRVLEACTCQDAQCTWTLTETLPPELEAHKENRLPGSLPLTKPASRE